MRWQRESWWSARYDDIVDVLSDTTESNVTFHLPNIHNTGCDNTYYYGLWCKNYYMLKQWKEDPKFANVRWFYRGMDDSWVHLENLVWFTKQYDHTKRIILGEKVCMQTGKHYPDGGPGFLISRGVLDALDTNQLLATWNRTLEINKPAPIYDDVIWGIMIELMNATLVHTPSMSHTFMSMDSDLYKLFLYQRHRTWGLSFRPVAYHQVGKYIEEMPQIDKELHTIDYGQVDPYPHTPPDCKCQIKHIKCAWNFELQGHKKPCNWSSPELRCLGPGPFPHWNTTIL